MFKIRFGSARIAFVGAGMALMLGGCVNVSQQTGAAGAQGASAAVAQAPVQPAPPPAPTGPLTYRVRRGDTLARVAQNNHCSVSDLVEWNGIKPSTHLKAGQLLKIVSPEVVATAAATAGANASAASASVAPAANPAVLRQVSAELGRHANSVQLAWPAQGSVVEAFQPGETRGIEIGGRKGDPVRAAANGKVMYAGTGLNEYGSLIIVQHNKDFLTAYSHNSRLLVKTGDIVRQGQQIAEMGDEKNSRVAVLFELRHDGKPIDPMPYLPNARG